jgi:hypothetical protein
MRRANLRTDGGTKIPDWVVGTIGGGLFGMTTTIAGSYGDEPPRMAYRALLGTLIFATAGAAVGAVVGHLRA